MQATHTFRPLSRPRLQRKCACGGTPGPTGECEKCRKKKLQRKTLGSEADPRASTLNAHHSDVPPIVHEVLRSTGQPLDPAARGFMESRFGHDFSQVRVHTNRAAAESATGLNALAYTVGQDMVFGAGQYSPDTPKGRRLLAHELTHVVQNDGVTTGSLIAMDSPDSAAEAEASRSEIALQPLRVRNTGVVLQRQGNKKPQSCSGWTCLADLTQCDRPDPGKVGNDQPSKSWTLSAMIDVDVEKAADVGITTFGHSYLKFSESNGTEYSYGFYPRTKAEVVFGGVKPTPGCIVHPDLTHLPCIDYEEKLTLTKGEYDKALENAKLWCHATPTYHLFDVNCTTFVAKVVEAAGKKLPEHRGKVSSSPSVTADNPNTLLESLRARDEAQKPQKPVNVQELANEIIGMIRFTQDRWVFSRLNSMWMTVMLDILTELQGKKYLDHLFDFFNVAQDVNKPRLMAAMRAVRVKASTAKPTAQQIDEILLVDPKLPDQQKQEIRSYLNR
jgi:hypothetical protein